MSFLDHLEELRWTLVRSSAALVVCMVGVFFYVQEIFDGFILGPAKPDFITYRALCALGRRLGMEGILCITDMRFNLVSSTPQQEFLMSFSIAFTLGFVIASPVIIWQIWRFVAPGLKEVERKAVRGTVVFVILLFLLGSAFAYWVVAPMSIQFFASYSLSGSITKLPTVDSYVSILNGFLLWTGLAFELPVVMVFLARLGIVGPSFLREYRRHAYVVILVVGAIITPPDAVSQVIVAVPLILLYEISILLASRAERKRQLSDPGTQAVRGR